MKNTPVNSPLAILEDRIPWFGRYNGYEPLVRYLPSHLNPDVIQARPGWIARARGKMHSWRHGLGPAPQAQVDAVRRFHLTLQSTPRQLGHVLYGEHVLPYLRSLSAATQSRMLLTLHQPYAQWQPAALQTLQELSRHCHVLMLFTPPPDTFQRHLSHQPHILPLGVDTDHFCPPLAPRERRVLYSGVHLRNLPMLERLIHRLLAADPKLAIDMLVPLAHRQREVFARLARLPQLVWHAGLDDAALLALYQRCRVMMLPMQDSGANTAVVESLACGLPVVTTRVGGIADYGGGTIFPVSENEDDDTALELILRMLNNDDEHARWSASVRTHAVQRLSWAVTVEQHLALYQRLAPDAGWSLTEQGEQK
jgi:glycosyltransferase involved in cell wall biosynthesis